MKNSIKKIISGGQTGADRGGLDAAISLDIPHGGFCPAGRLAEDGTIPVIYNMTELFSKSYAHRTEQNVIDSDITLIFTYGTPVYGSKLTVSMAIKHSKPYYCLDLRKDDNIIISELLTFLRTQKLTSSILNIAGSRESSAHGIQKRVFNILLKVLNS
jgi:hypothetical protein